MTEEKKFVGMGAPKESEPLSLLSYPLPPLSPTDIEVVVEWCGLCHSDLHSIDNDWGNSVFPLVPGHEVVGTISFVGEHVPSSLSLNIGDRVGIGPNGWACFKCSRCLGGEPNYCAKGRALYNSKDPSSSLMTKGGFGERVRVRGEMCVKIPKDYPSPQAAPMLCAGVTVFAPLNRYVTPGDHVAVMGIGGLGHLGIMFAKAMGAKVTAISSSNSKRELCAKLGADHYVNMNGKTEAEKKEMKSLRHSLSLLLVTSSGANLDERGVGKLVSWMGVGGNVCFVGIPNPGVIPVNIFQLLARRVVVSASGIGSPNEMRMMFDFATKHKIYPFIEKYRLKEDINLALDRMKEGKPRFRCVLQANL